ncbi:MAG: copper resistance protein B [Pseudomonadota bacterium]|nr:copper resistance protein B [Pseudomonadota bacterium]
MNRALVATLAVGAALTVAWPATAQDSMRGMAVKGMKMPMPAPAKKKTAPATPVKKPPASASAAKPVRAPKAPAKAMDGMDMSGGARAPAGQSMPGMDMAGGTKAGASAPTTMPGMTTPGMAMPDTQASGTALPAGNAPAPPPPTGHYADRFFPPADIHKAHRAMMKEQGGRNFSQIMFNLAEYQIRDGKHGYRWDGEGWFGGDINRLVIKTEGEGTFRQGIDSAEVQALYSRAVGPYFNLQAGVRHDFQPSPTRTYATVGFEGLAPYMFEVGGAAFLSNKGEVLGRLEGYYDQRITQRLILQPRVELNLSAQDVPEHRLGAGLTNAELGLRLRYEIVREFAPYIGVSYDAKTGRTADFARADGKDATSTSLVAGAHFWF